jgi:hypothetical protein
MAERTSHTLAALLGGLLRRLRSLPRRLFGRWIARLPLDFRVLYRQFLLRIVDLESLSIDADMADMLEYLGQFAGILLFVSTMQALGGIMMIALHPLPPTPAELYWLGWRVEHGMVERMFLAAGMVTVFLWDAVFPDRRDVMVLGPLPVRPGTILAAKVASPAALLGMTVVCLNLATNLAWPLILGALPHGLAHGLRLGLACWLAVVAATLTLFASLLAVQGLSALLLPRAAFLRVNAGGQLAAFVLFPTAYFLWGGLDSPAEILAPANHALVSAWPGYWFLALLKQAAGEMPPEMHALATRAWTALALSVVAASAALLACYRHTLRAIVEQPDLQPAGRTLHWTPRLGNRLSTAMVLFGFRTLARSRQHRLALAFAWALVLAMVLAMTRDALTSPWPRPVGDGFLVPTFLMMALAVAGLRATFSLPVALKANWVLRVAQLRPTEDYLAATRRVLFLLAVLPVWVVSFLFSLGYRPWLPAAEHLVLLGFFGLVAVEFSLLGFAKIPFTCSYLPGKANVQYVFWGFLLVFLFLALLVPALERPALADPFRLLLTAGAYGGIAALLRLWNRARERETELYFEERPEQPILTLNLKLDPYRDGS